MTLRDVKALEERPRITLSEWALIEVPSGGTGRPWTRHLVGWACDTRRGRVSSPVLQLEPDTATCVTVVGRVYLLFGAPGLCPEGKRVLEQWLHLYRVVELRDLTAEAFVAIQDAHDAARRVH